MVASPQKCCVLNCWCLIGCWLVCGLDYGVSVFSSILVFWILVFCFPINFGVVCCTADVCICLVGCWLELVVGLNGVHGSRGLHRPHVVLMFGLWIGFLCFWVDNGTHGNWIADLVLVLVYYCVDIGSQGNWYWCWCLFSWGIFFFFLVKICIRIGGWMFGLKSSGMQQMLG